MLQAFSMERNRVIIDSTCTRTFSLDSIKFERSEVSVCSWARNSWLSLPRRWHRSSSSFTCSSSLLILFIVSVMALIVGRESLSVNCKSQISLKSGLIWAVSRGIYPEIVLNWLFWTIFDFWPPFNSQYRHKRCKVFPISHN